MNDINGKDLEKVLPALDCASCGTTEILHLVIDACFKLSRASNDKNILKNNDPQITRFILSEEQSRKPEDFIKKVAQQLKVFEMDHIN